MRLLSRQLAIGIGRVAKLSGLMMCYRPWKKQIFNANSWNKVQGTAKAVRYELRNAVIQSPVWETLAAGETLPDCMVIASSEIPRHLFLKATSLRWRGKHIDEMENGVQFELIRTFLR